MPQLDIVLANEVAEVGRLHRVLAQFWSLHRLPPDLEDDLGLALEEIIVNVIRYGHPEGGKHEILVRLSLEAGVVTAVVEDDGLAFNPLEAPPPDFEAPLEQRGIGGLGIHLVKNLMDGVVYRREENRNVLVMRKRVLAAGERN